MNSNMSEQTRKQCVTSHRELFFISGLYVIDCCGLFPVQNSSSAAWSGNDLTLCLLMSSGRSLKLCLLLFPFF